MENLLNTIKKAAVEAVEATNPMTLVEGTVKTKKPLKIQTDQMIPLTEEFLILCDSVKDRETEIDVDWETGTSDLHTHTIKGKKKITIKDGLKAGDRVVMIRMPGAQKYYVIGRLTNDSE